MERTTTASVERKGEEIKVAGQGGTDVQKEWVVVSREIMSRVRAILISW